MILLDTDHLTILRYTENPRYSALTSRLDSATDRRHVVCIVSVEEQMRGWLAEIARHRNVLRQVPSYERLAQMINFFKKWEVLMFDKRAANVFVTLRNERLRIGTQDLKIASIAIVNDALLLTANLRDFEKVPGLRVENWLRP